MSSAILFVPDVPEFESVVIAARSQPDCTVTGPTQGYYVLRTDKQMTFSRKALSLKPAIWYGIPTGGLVGKIERFDRDALVIVATTDG